MKIKCLPRASEWLPRSPESEERLRSKLASSPAPLCDISGSWSHISCRALVLVLGLALLYLKVLSCQDLGASDPCYVCEYVLPCGKLTTLSVTCSVSAYEVSKCLVLFFWTQRAICSSLQEASFGVGHPNKKLVSEGLKLFQGPEGGRCKGVKGRTRRNLNISFSAMGCFWMFGAGVWYGLTYVALWTINCCGPGRDRRATGGRHYGAAGGSVCLCCKSSLNQSFQRIPRQCLLCFTLKIRSAICTFCSLSNNSVFKYDICSLIWVCSQVQTNLYAFLLMSFFVYDTCWFYYRLE